MIEAYAGTCNTFSLVTRLLRLIFGGTEPERIVALTFSRAAAGEIFNNFIERLSNAAADDTVAAAESERVGMPLTKGDFRASVEQGRLLDEMMALESVLRRTEGIFRLSSFG